VLKISSAVIILLALVLYVAESTYRVTASAKLQGSIERVVVAPYSGYISEARVKAGDRVNENEVLVVLDNKDKRIERAKWASQKEQFSRQYLEAMANHNRPQTRILNAKIAQAEAQIKLLDAQISRSRILSPFDGLVVSGDLSQSLGEPVEKGDTLYKVAPLEEYRVMLDIDERDVSELHAGQQGHLVLTAVPGVILPIVIERITSVTSAAEGKNTFKTEAHLLDAPQFLRPGMLGTGKVDVGERSILWIWTHRLVDWFRIQVWMWLS
jgi:RND family efflux transporter MFP subunit